MAETYTSVDEWLNEIEAFSLRQERLPAGALPWVEAAWRLGGKTARVDIADEIDTIRMDEVLLAMGEMTAQERRNARALIGFIANRVRSPAASTGS